MGLIGNWVVAACIGFWLLLKGWDWVIKTNIHKASSHFKLINPTNIEIQSMIHNQILIINTINILQ